MLQNARLWLESIHPAAPWALLTLAIFAAVYLSRKFLPGLWVWFDKVTPDGTIGHVVQGLPSIGIGAIATVILTGGDFALAWKGAVFGALAPVLHLILKAVPVPYQGAVAAVAKKAGISLVGLVLLVLFLPGCSSQQAAKFIDTAVEVAERVEEVARVLCLAQHARQAHARAFSVREACDTREEIQPFLSEAQGQIPRGACQ